MEHRDHMNYDQLTRSSCVFVTQRSLEVAQTGALLDSPGWLQSVCEECRRSHSFVAVERLQWRRRWRRCPCSYLTCIEGQPICWSTPSSDTHVVGAAGVCGDQGGQLALRPRDDASHRKRLADRGEPKCLLSLRRRVQRCRRLRGDAWVQLTRQARFRSRSGVLGAPVPKKEWKTRDINDSVVASSPLAPLIGQVLRCSYVLFRLLTRLHPNSTAFVEPACR